MDRILGAIRDRVHIPSGAAHRIAGRNSKSGDNQGRSRNFLKHELSSLHPRNDHRTDQIALSAALATEFTSRAAPRTVLQAAVASAATIKTATAIFSNMTSLPL
jgi:hypothetical protein